MQNMSNVSARVLNLVFAVADAVADAEAVVVAFVLLLCWLFAWPLGRVGSLHRVSEWVTLGAESMHRVHGYCRWAFRWCKSRFWNHDFGVIPCILEHGASD